MSRVLSLLAGAALACGAFLPAAAQDAPKGDVANGNVLFAEKGGIEAAVNVGNETFYEIIVELKD